MSNTYYTNAATSRPNLNGCGCGSNANYQLGALTDTEFKAIVTNHFKSLPTPTLIAIGSETATLKFDTLTDEFRKLQTQICQTGVKSQLKDVVDNNILYFGIGALALTGFYIYRNTAAPKRRR
jgi:hypothetical protein